MTELVLIRGLPGSGKSTLAKAYMGYRHFEADQLFEREGAYVFDAALLDEAHRVCFENTRNALAQGHNVVVSNTFSRRREIEPYVALGYPTQVIEARGRFSGVHRVSSEVMARLAGQWECWPTPNGRPPPVKTGDDAVTVWEWLVGKEDSISSIGLFEYVPLPPLQGRLKLVASDAETLESARCASVRWDIPFWDAVMRNGLRPDGLSDDLLDAVTLANPANIVPAGMTRDEVLDGRLRGRVEGVAADRVLAIVSGVQLRSGIVAHFPMLDFRCPVGPYSERIVVRIGLRLLEHGGIVMQTARSYHLVGRVPVSADKLHRFLAQSLFYAPLVDRMYVAHHLLRGQCTLRISAAPVQSTAPIMVSSF